jgi:phospholipase C
VPYALHVRGEADFFAGSVKIHFANTGRAAAVFQVRSAGGLGGPWTYTVGPDARLSDTWAVRANGQTGYNLSVYGPNGFLRAFEGSISVLNKANVRIDSEYGEEENTIFLKIQNTGSQNAEVRIQNLYNGKSTFDLVMAGKTVSRAWQLEDSFGWYDLMVEVASEAGLSKQHLAGHVETGNDSMTDPAIGASA